MTYDPDLENARPTYEETIAPMKLYKTISNSIMSNEQLLYYGILEYYPKISKTDIDNRYFIRYFTRMANQSAGEILEISKQTYDKIKFNNLFLSIELHWKIAGKLDDIPGPVNINTPTRLYTGVTTWNKIAILDADTKINGIKDKLTNFNQFYSGTG